MSPAAQSSLTPRQSCGVDSAAEPTGYVAGDAFVSRMPLLAGNDDATEVYEALVEPLVSELIAEAGPLTASTRIKIELLANAVSDWATFTAYARRAAQRPGKEGLVLVERWYKLADRASKRILDCLDQLGRPSPTAVKISVSGANVNLGQQMVAPSGSGRHRKRRTSKSNGAQ